MCVDYDTSVAKSCREPIAEEVKEKDRANFCDYFKPRPDAYRPRDQTAERKSRTALDAIFGGQAGTAGGGSCRRQLARQARRAVQEEIESPPQDRLQPRGGILRVLQLRQVGEPHDFESGKATRIDARKRLQIVADVERETVITAAAPYPQADARKFAPADVHTRRIAPRLGMDAELSTELDH